MMKEGIPAGDNTNMFNELCQQLSIQAGLAGVNQIDILNLPPPLDSALTKIVRQGSMTVSELADDLHLTEPQGNHLVDILVEKGYLRTEISGRVTLCKINFARKKNRVSTDIWDALDF